MTPGLVIFDCDGVLWEGTRLIPGAVDVLAYLRSLGACPGPARAARPR